MKSSLINKEADVIGEVEVSDQIFGIKPKLPSVHAALVWELARRRVGGASTKTRAQVRGGGVKPYRQKGTGRARAGSIRSPLWRGGGVIFGPKPRSYKYALPKKVVKLALRSVLSDRMKENKVMVVEAFEFAQSKTKEAADFLAKLKIFGKILVLSAGQNAAEERSFRNLAAVKYCNVLKLNIHDLIQAENILITKEGLKKLAEVAA